MLAALGARGLRAYLAGNLFSIIGTWGQRVVVYWMAWDLTGSSAILGVLAGLDLAPAVLAAPLAGALADTRPARRLAINLQLLSALPPLALAGLALAGMIELPVLLAVTLVTGMLGGFDHPLRLLLVGSVVERQHVSSAIALNSIVFNVGRMIGPVAGGWAVSAGRPELVFVLNALSFLFFALALHRSPVSEEDAPRAKADGGGVGLRAVLRALEAPDRRLVFYFAAIALMARPLFELLPVFAGEFASAALPEARAYSILTSVQGLGAMLGGVATSVLVSRYRQRTVALIAGLVATATLLAFLSSGGHFPFALAALAVIAGAVLTNGISTQMILQTRLPRSVRGRALGLYTMTLRGMPALGAFILGVLGDFVPQREVFVVAAALLLLLGVAFVVAVFLMKED